MRRAFASVPLVVAAVRDPPVVADLLTVEPVGQVVAPPDGTLVVGDIGQQVAGVAHHPSVRRILEAMSDKASVTVRYWAGARRAAGTAQEQLSAASVAELRELLRARPGFDRVADVSSYLVDGAQASETTALPDGATVDVLPPFAGG